VDDVGKAVTDDPGDGGVGDLVADRLGDSEAVNDVAERRWFHDEDVHAGERGVQLVF
jgi:hypothetical protein